MGFTVDLQNLIVRPSHPGESGRWDQLMSVHHYLGHHHLVGKSLKYVAEFDGQWVALLGWASPAFKCGARDEWIGWAKEQRWQRPKYIVNNVRFLILSGVHIANLASRALALNCRRLAKDFATVYGHPVVLAETFVDPQRFVGTCYRAANWDRLGHTVGYGRQSGEYYYHGQQKTVWVYPLHRQARRLLTAPFLARALEGRVGIMDLNETVIDEPGGLLQRFAKLVDVRKRRGVRHTWVSVFAVATCAGLSEADGFQAIGEWAQSLSQENLKDSVPSSGVIWGTGNASPTYSYHTICPCLWRVFPMGGMGKICAFKRALDREPLRAWFLRNPRYGYPHFAGRQPTMLASPYQAP
jgi:hypothetical protein